MTQPPLLAGLELGGTKCNAVLARGDMVIDRASVPTTTPAATLAALTDVVRHWTSSHAIAGLGVASFGPLCLDRSATDYGHIIATPKPGWSNTDVVGHFIGKLGLPTGFDTDVNGAALAEGEWGAARDCDVHAYVTVGTGVGVGIVIDGQPLHGRLHPEAGHMRIRRADRLGFEGSCPFHGDCVEGLVSGPAIAARAGVAAALVADSDPLWDIVAADIGELLANLILVLSPRRIVIGGGVLQRRPQLLAMARRATQATLNAYLPDQSQDDLAALIVPPHLGLDAGALGATILAQRMIGP